MRVKSNLKLRKLGEISMRKIIFILLSIAFFCLIGCEYSSMLNKQDNEIGISPEVINKEYTSDFVKFINSFKSTNLPLKIYIGSEGWIDFHSNVDDLIIERNQIIKYIFKGDSLRIDEPSGGRFNYYYGNCFKLEKNIGITYYRPSTKDYNGYMLNVFNEFGDKKGELLLAGDKGEFDSEAQIESQIGIDGKIQVIELEYKNKIDFSGKIFLATLFKTHYEILSNGEISEISKERRMNVKVKYLAGTNRVILSE